MNVVVSPIAPSELPLVFNSWLKFYRKCDYARGIPDSVFYAEEHRVIEALLAREGTVVVAARNSEDLDQIFGYAVYEVKPRCTVLHWVYVKHPFRNLGIGKQLLAPVVTRAVEVPLWFSYRTRPLENWQSLYSLGKYNPYAKNPNS